MIDKLSYHTESRWERVVDANMNATNGKRMRIIFLLRTEFLPSTPLLSISRGVYDRQTISRWKTHQLVTSNDVNLFNNGQWFTR